MGITDYGEALKGLRKAATQGLPWAQVSLAQMYEAGEGVPGSNAVAGRWYKKAADHFRDVAVVWEAEVNSADMYRDDQHQGTTCKRTCGSLSSAPQWTLWRMRT